MINKDSNLRASDWLSPRTSYFPWKKSVYSGFFRAGSGGCHLWTNGKNPGDAPISYIKSGYEPLYVEVLPLLMLESVSHASEYILGVYRLYEKLTRRVQILFESCASGGSVLIRDCCDICCKHGRHRMIRMQWNVAVGIQYGTSLISPVKRRVWDLTYQQCRISKVLPATSLMRADVAYSEWI